MPVPTEIAVLIFHKGSIFDAEAGKFSERLEEKLTGRKQQKVLKRHKNHNSKSTAMSHAAKPNQKTHHAL